MEIKIVSTEYDRTIESALSNLAGMYPPVAEDEFVVGNMPWQPIPVRSTPAAYDVFLGLADCPAYSSELQAVMKSQPIADLLADAKPLFAYITQHSGHNVTTIAAAVSIYDNLIINSKFRNRVLVGNLKLL